MAKFADRYLEVNPWAIIEKGFDPTKNRVSESIFSLGNEYMGIRGIFDEGYSGETLVGSYFNGVYEEAEIKHPNKYKGIATRTRFMVNTVNWLSTCIVLDGEVLDLAKSKISDFVRTLDLKSGVVSREFIWHTNSGKILKLLFERFLSMQDANLGCQKISI